MGILDAFRPSTAGRQVGDVVDRAVASYVPPMVDPSTLPIASPWSGSNNLQRLVVEDIWGTDVPVNTRAAAMRLPAISRGRNLIVSAISRMPLAAFRYADRLDPTPSWMLSTGDGSSPQLRNAWTVDDLMFYGWSCWWRTNGADGPLAARRLNIGEWCINADNRVEIHGQVIDDQNVIVIPGLHEGILSFGVDVLSDAKALYRIVRQRLANPVPQIDLHQTSGGQLTNQEIDKLIDDWAAARRGDNGGVAYTNQFIEAREMGAADAQLMIEARNAASLDLARLVGITAGMVDATAPKASLNYETSQGRNQEFVDFDLALYMTPITARLSLDDVMPRGQRAAFDVEEFTSQAPAYTGPAVED